jgi:hypothetical protein
MFIRSTLDSLDALDALDALYTSNALSRIHFVNILVIRL